MTRISLFIGAQGFGIVSRVPFWTYPCPFVSFYEGTSCSRIMMNGADARIIHCLYRPPVIAILLYLGHTRPPNPLLVGFFTIQGVLSV